MTLPDHIQAEIDRAHPIPEPLEPHRFYDPGLKDITFLFEQFGGLAPGEYEDIRASQSELDREIKICARSRWDASASWSSAIGWVRVASSLTLGQSPPVWSLRRFEGVDPLALDTAFAALEAETGLWNRQHALLRFGPRFPLIGALLCDMLGATDSQATACSPAAPGLDEARSAVSVAQSADARLELQRHIGHREARRQTFYQRWDAEREAREERRRVGLALASNDRERDSVEEEWRVENSEANRQARSADADERCSDSIFMNFVSPQPCGPRHWDDICDVVASYALANHQLRSTGTRPPSSERSVVIPWRMQQLQSAPREPSQFRAWQAMGATAANAALALGAEHLVGKWDLTQAHIEVLLAPYIAVFRDPREQVPA